jgi:hypothetical protein
MNEMKTLKDYMLMKQTPYKYKIKFAYPMEEHHFERLSNVLDKYEMASLNNIIRTPFQKSPLDFPTVTASEIYIIEVETMVPMSESALPYEIKMATKIHEDFIVVRGENSPYNEYEENLLKFQEGKYVPKLEDSHYESDGVETQELYGDEYNKKMVAELVKDSEPYAPHIKTEFMKAVESFNKTGVFSKLKDV